MAHKYNLMNGKQFKKQMLIKNIVSEQWPDHLHTVFYVFVHKESQTGLLFNQRMLVLQDQDYSIFYTKFIKPLSILFQEAEVQNKVILKGKMSISSAQLSQQENIITITDFQSFGEKKFIFKFYSASLAQKWMYLFQEHQEKMFAKSLKSKKTKESTENESNLSILISSKSLNHKWDEKEIQSEVQRKEQKEVLKMKQELNIAAKMKVKQQLEWRSQL